MSALHLIGLVLAVSPCFAADGVLDISKSAIATLQVPGSADFLIADGDDVWITNQGRVERLRCGEPRPIATVRMPQPAGAMAIGFGSLWVASGGTNQSLHRIGRDTARVDAVIPTGLADPDGELSVAVGAGSVWLLTDRKGELSRIDPAKNAVVAKIAVIPDSFAAAFGFGSVWITNTKSNSVQRIDPASNRVLATIPVGPTPRFLATGEHGVWTLNQGDGSVSRINIEQNKLEATIHVGVEGEGGDIEAGQSRVWVRASKVLLSVIDPDSNQVVRRYGPKAGSGAVRVAGPYVWVSAHDVKTVWVLRP